MDKEWDGLPGGPSGWLLSIPSEESEGRTPETSVAHRKINERIRPVAGDLPWARCASGCPTRTTLDRRRVVKSSRPVWYRFPQAGLSS